MNLQYPLSKRHASCTDDGKEEYFMEWRQSPVVRLVQVYKVMTNSGKIITPCSFYMQPKLSGKKIGNTKQVLAFPN